MAIRDKKTGGILLIKGIDISTPAEYIADNSARNSENFDNSRGVLVKRAGTIKLGDTTALISGTDVEIMGGREFNREGVKYNVRIGRDKVQYFNTTTSEWVDITGTDLTGTTTDLVDTAVPLLSGKRILCFTNNKDVIRKWTATGNTAALGGTPPIAKFIQEYKTYLMCANIGGGTDISQRVQWSDAADPETWTGGNSGAVDLVEDGGDITALTLFGDYICVHKEGSIYLGYPVSSSAVFKFDRKATGVGTVAHQSVQGLPTGEQIFLAKDGIYLFNGVNCRKVSDAINEEIRDSINSEYANKAWSVLVKERDEVHIGIPIGSQTSGETVYKYNYRTGIVLKDIRTNANTAWIGESSAGVTWDDLTISWDSSTSRWDGAGLAKGSDVINIATSDGYTYKVSNSVNSDDGVAINSLWETGDFQDSQQRMMRPNKLEVWAKGGSISVEYSTDKGTTWTTMSESPMSLTDEYPDFDSPDIFYFDVVGSQIRFRFTNSETDESLGIKQFILSYIPREERR